MKTIETTNATQEIPFLGDITFAENPEPRCCCAIVPDRSGSMDGPRINALNAGLQELKSQILTDRLASLRLELAVVSFNGTVTVNCEFVPPAQFDPPTLNAGGGTSMGAALLRALDLVELRMDKYRAEGLSSYRPWILLITDGEPTDDVSEAARRIKEAEQRRRLSFFAVGVEGANISKLSQLCIRQPLSLDGLRFTDLFAWLSVNLSSVASSRPGDQIALTPPDWSVA